MRLSLYLSLFLNGNNIPQEIKAHLPILIYCSSERTLNTHTHLFNPFLMYFPGDFWPPKNDSPCPPDENENCWFFRYIPKSKKWLNYHFRKHIWASSHRPVYEHLKTSPVSVICVTCDLKAYTQPLQTKVVQRPKLCIIIIAFLKKKQFLSGWCK